MRQHPLLRILLPALALAAPAAAQESLHARVDSVFARFATPESPGCAVGIYRDGRMEYAQGYGMANLELAVPITPRTVFDIGSTSKQFTAASLVLLAQQGKLSLDDDVRKHIPELPDFGRTITIRHLLHHTSGLRDYIGLMILAGHDIDDVTTARTTLDILARQKALNFNPGDEHLYSNSGYFLGSIIVERAAGMSLRRFAEENLFAPLGMRNTRFRDDHTELVPNRATAYAPRAGAGFRMDVSNWEQLGDGAVFTTVEDLLLWDQNFYDPRVGGEAMLASLQTPGTLNSGGPMRYALGLGVTEFRGLRVVSHGGAWGGYRADLMRFPTERLSVAVLCNLATTNPTALARQVAEIYLGDRLAPAPARPGAPAGPARPAVAVDAEELRRWAGTYRDPTGGLRTFREQDGKLMLDVSGQTAELRPVRPSEFEVIGAPWTFRFTPGGDGRREARQIAGTAETVFQAIELANPTPAELQAYAGAYYSGELDVTYRVAVEGSVLVLHGPFDEPMRLRPLERDEFTAQDVTFRFAHAATGAITGFTLNQGRIRNLGFERVEPRAGRALP